MALVYFAEEAPVLVVSSTDIPPTVAMTLLPAGAAQLIFSVSPIESQVSSAGETSTTSILEKDWIDDEALRVAL